MLKEVQIGTAQIQKNGKRHSKPTEVLIDVVRSILLKLKKKPNKQNEEAILSGGQFDTENQ